MPDFYFQSETVDDIEHKFIDFLGGIYYIVGMAQRILIIDDELYLRELYEEVIQSAGYEVETALDGKEGLEKIRTGNFDLILLDVMMPELDGIGVMQKLNTEDPKPAKMPVIVICTNLSHDPVINEAIKLGAKAYIVKADVVPDQIIEKIKQLLGGTTAPVPVPTPQTPIEPQAS
ncbi:response regulator [Candidatus Microgenomates bacterium]|nr:response regulator [Candidatus Microgenomates bacterium]